MKFVICEPGKRILHTNIFKHRYILEITLRQNVPDIENVHKFIFYTIKP